jgi:hypothetical protein
MLVELVYGLWQDQGSIALVLHVNEFVFLEFHGVVELVYGLW